MAACGSMHSSATAFTGLGHATNGASLNINNNNNDASDDDSNVGEDKKFLKVRSNIQCFFRANLGNP